MGTQDTWPALPFTLAGCVSLTKELNLSEPEGFQSEQPHSS